MKERGFTLIELLAVIVILAIIALIATPIILGIINDAKRESNERSIDMYANAAKQAMARYHLEKKHAATEFSQIEPYIEIGGSKVSCTTEKINSDGSIYLAGCTVNGAQVDYTYGTAEDTKPTRYYSRGGGVYGALGNDLPIGASTNIIKEDGPYIAVDVDGNDKVTDIYICVTRNSKEYCLKYGDTQENLDAIAAEAYKDVIEAGICNLDELMGNGAICRINDVEYVYSGSPTYIYVTTNGHQSRCTAYFEEYDGGNVWYDCL